MLALTPGATTAELNLAWYSGTEGTKTAVRLFNASGALVNTVTGTTGSATTGKRWHKATLKELAPNTKYKYSVSNDEQNWSKEYDYTTPPATGAWRFVAIADPQIRLDSVKSHSSWAEIAAKIAATPNVSHITSSGDQVDDMTSGKDEEEWKILFAPGIFRNIPIAPVKGNHDNGSQLGYHFNLPNKVNKCSSANSYYCDHNYYYLYNNILFVGLNSGTLYEQSTDAQFKAVVDHFGEVISTAKTAHAGKYDWLIVLHHESTKSVSAHAEDVEIVKYKAQGFETIMSQQGVDLVIAGHDHVYARTNPINGVVYLTLKAASNYKFYPIIEALAKQEFIAVYSKPSSSWKYDWEGRPSWIQVFEPEYTVIDVNGKTLNFEVCTRTECGGTDKFTLTK